MNIDDIRSGDIITFVQDGKRFHGRVSSIGWRYTISPFRQDSEERLLFVRCLEHPDWKELTLKSRDVVDASVIPEKVQFT